MVNSTDFGSFLKLHRRMAELTLNDVSEKIGISIAYYSDIENSRRHISNRNILKKLAAALKLSDKDTTFFFQLADKSRAAAVAELDMPEYVSERQAV